MPVTLPTSTGRTGTAAPPRLPRRLLLGRVLLGAASGVVLALAFPPYDGLGGWLAVPAVALLVGCLRGTRPRQAAGVGLVAGLGFFLVLLSWLRVLGPDAWLLLALLSASFWAGGAALAPAILRTRWWVLGLPLLWVCVEAARARAPFGGFPWGRLAYAQAGTPLRGWATLGGPALVSFVVALLGCLLVVAVGALRRRRGGVAAAAALGGVGLAAAGAMLSVVPWAGPVVARHPIAVVQGNVPRVGLDFNAQRRAVLDNHVRATELLAAQVATGASPQPVAVVWPENSSDIDALRNADAGQQIDRAADAIGAPLLVGTILANPDDPSTVLNVSLVWDPVSGPQERYVKRHPVPFGEYVPLRGLLAPLISRFDRVPRDFAAGSEPGVLPLGPVRAGVVICFEIAYDGLVRDAVRGGGQVLVVQTNNATYGLTGQPEQQLAITRIQAVASGRSTLVAATSGISAVIDERGDLRWTAPEFRAASKVADVPVRSGLTPAMRVGAGPELAAVVGSLAVLAGVGWAGRRRRARAPRAGAFPPGPPPARGTLEP